MRPASQPRVSSAAIPLGPRSPRHCPPSSHGPTRRARDLLRKPLWVGPWLRCLGSPPAGWRHVLCPGAPRREACSSEGDGGRLGSSAIGRLVLFIPPGMFRPGKKRIAVDDIPDGDGFHEMKPADIPRKIGAPDMKHEARGVTHALQRLEARRPFIELPCHPRKNSRCGPKGWEGDREVLNPLLIRDW